jgi:SNF2 family DNA or RNA helicase
MSIYTNIRPLEVEGKDILVFPPKYPSTEVKEELGGRWDKNLKGWRVAPTSFNVQVLVSWYGEELLDGAPTPVVELFTEQWGFPGWYEAGTTTPNGHHDDLRKHAEAHPKWDMLFPFQRVAVEYICCNPHRGTLLGLSPGLGKTPVSVVAMDVLDCTKVLVLAPLTLARNWIAEVDTWSNQYRSMSRATAAEKDPTTEFVVTNFETLFEPIFRDEDGKVVDVPGGPKKQKEWIEAGPTKVAQNGKRVPARERIVQPRKTYAEIDWDLIIVDESILFKNRKAVKVGVVQQLAKYSNQVWLLSGSPTSKYRDDLFPQLQTIMPRGFTSYWRFADQFCIVEKGKWGWDITGDRPGVDLHSMLKDFMFTKDQSEVLPDLPDYIFRPLVLTPNATQRRAHDTMTDQWVAMVEEAMEGDEVKAPNRLAQMTRLQQITSNTVNLKKDNGKPYPNSSVKEDALVDMIKNDEVETPLLVWVNYVPTGESYKARLEKEFKDLSVEFIHGDATTKSKKDQREDTLQRFKDGDLDVLIMQYKVGKFGHTFTKTRTVYYGDRSWDADDIVQSLRRVRRIGLEHSPVLIVPRCPGTIDDLVEQILEGKLTSISEVSNADLVELLRSLGRDVR